MSVKLYDDAFLNKLKFWTNNTDIHIYGAEETTRLFEVQANNNNDRPIKLPIIVLRRIGGYSVDIKGKRAFTFDGLTTDSTKEKSTHLNAIPISIPYQLDIYTRYLEEADQYMRSLIFNIINHPKLTVTIPYQGKDLLHDSNIRISSDVKDNSNIKERLVSGQFTRFSIGIISDDAYLWDIRTGDNYSLDSSSNILIYNSDDKLEEYEPLGLDKTK